MAKIVNVGVKYIRPRYDDLEQWMKDPRNVYIGNQRRGIINGKRYPPTPSPWYNPFKVGRDGTIDEVFEKYRIYIEDRIQRGVVDLEELRGKVLGCWCKTRKNPDAPCHGDVLLGLLLLKGLEAAAFSFQLPWEEIERVIAL